LLGAQSAFTRAATFHAQQAAEKALKGFLTWHDTPFRKTHDLLELATTCAPIDSDLGSLATPATALTPFAWSSRYPGDDAPTVQAAENALERARRLYRAVLDRLLSEVRP